MKHLALVIPGLDRIGGAERQVVLLAQGFRRRGMQVSVVCLSGDGGASKEELASAGIEVVLLKMHHGLKDPGGWLRYVQWLHLARPDVVHAHLPHATGLARWSRLAAPVQVVVDTIHSTATGGWTRCLGYRLSNWLTDQVTAVSAAAASSWQMRGLVAAEQLTTLPNGVAVAAQLPTPDERQAARAQLGLSANFQWLAAGRLEQVKDYPTLLKAFAGLAPRCELSIAGTGTLENELQQLAVQLGISDRVHWLGFVPNVRLRMLAADGFVLSSLWEGLPLGLLEAAAIGLPAVATDGSGIGEAMESTARAGLTPVRDGPALSRSMQRLMAMSDEERRHRGEQAYLFVQTHYSLESVLDRWETLFNELLQKNERPRRWRR